MCMCSLFLCPLHCHSQSPGQIGSYFGAEVRAVDTDGDDISDLILVSAPMHMEDEQEGKVFVYQFKTEVSLSTGDLLCDL